jgi:hypothetical protein
MTVHFRVAEEQRLVLATSVAAMVYGGHFYLVWNTEIHALCSRGHRAPD